jgi:chromosome segregation ATPase
MTAEERESLRELLVEQAVEHRRLLQALAEDFSSQVRILADGHLLLQEKLDQLGGEVRRHSQQLEIVSADVAWLRVSVGELRADVDELKQGQAELRADVDELKQGQAELRADVDELKQGQAELRADIDELKQGQAELRADIDELKKGQAELRADVDELKQGQAELRADVNRLAEGQAELRQELRGFRAEVGAEFTELRAQIRLSYSGLDQRLQTLEHEVQDLRSRVLRLEERVGV